MGTAESPLKISLTGTTTIDGWITARGHKGVYLDFGGSTVFIREIGSTDGDVSLTAKEILNGLAGLETARIAGKNIVLVATKGSIGGSETDMFRLIQNEGGSVSLTAATNIYVMNPRSSMNIVKAVTGDDGEFFATANNSLSLTEAGIDLNVAVLKAINGNITVETALTVTDELIMEAGDSILLTGTEEVKLGTGTMTANTGDITVDTALTVLDGHDITAEKNVFLNALLTVKNGTINIVAKNGGIVNGNDDTTNVLNIDAVNSDLIMIANTGIGNGNAIEVNVKSIAAKTTIGDIVLANAGDTTLNATTGAGSVDVYSGGQLIVGEITALGVTREIVLGAVEGIQLTGADLQAALHIILVSQNGDITTGTGMARFNATESFLQAQSGMIDVALDIDGKLNLVAKQDISATKLNQGDFDLGSVFSGNAIKLAVQDGFNSMIDHILGRSIEVDVDNFVLNDTGSSAVFSLDGKWTNHGNYRNETLLEGTHSFTHEEIEISNKKEGGSMTIETLTIDPGKHYETKVDNLVLDTIFGGEGSSLSHLGRNGGIADSTTIGDIVSDSDFVIQQLFSNNVNVNASNLSANLITQDGLLDNGEATFTVNGITTRIDDTDKNQRDNLDFWVWSRTGGYGLSANQTGIDTTQSQMAVLQAAQTDLLLNGNTTNFDSALESNQTDMRSLSAGRSEFRNAADRPLGLGQK